MSKDTIFNSLTAEEKENYWQKYAASYMYCQRTCQDYIEGPKAKAIIEVYVDLFGYENIHSANPYMIFASVK